jgi:hypothetical protein
VLRRAAEDRLQPRNWIIWHYTFGQQTRKDVRQEPHAHPVLHARARTGSRSTPTRCASPAPARRTYADKRANSKGKLPDDTWFLRPQEAAPARRTFESGYDTWNESRVCGTFKEREGWHGCQMPIGVLNRIIKASSNPGDVVLDPFQRQRARRSSRPRCSTGSSSGSTSRREYVGYATKRLNTRWTSRQQKNGKGDVAATIVLDAKRASKVADGDRRLRPPPRRSAGRRSRRTIKGENHMSPNDVQEFLDESRHRSHVVSSCPVEIST